MPDQRLRCRRDPVVQQVPASLAVPGRRVRPLVLVVQQGPLVPAVPPVRQVPAAPVLRRRPYRPFHLANLAALCRPSILEHRLLQPVRLALEVLADPLDPAGLEVLVVLHSRRDLVKVLELESAWAWQLASESASESASEWA